ncbi:MAG: hypothetical protein RL367_50, partial [Pseudomonadota bacterium]
MIAVALVEAVAEKLIIIFQLEPVDLQPHAGNEDRIDMGRETAMGFVDVTANVA